MQDLNNDAISEGFLHTLLSREEGPDKDYSVFTMFVELVTLLADQYEPSYLSMLIFQVCNVYQVVLEEHRRKHIATTFGVNVNRDLYLEVNTETKEILGYVGGKVEYRFELSDSQAENLREMCKMIWDAKCWTRDWEIVWRKGNIVCIRSER